MRPRRVVVLVDPDAPTERLVSRGLELAEALGCALHVRLVSDPLLTRVGEEARFLVLPEGRVQAVDPAAVQRAAVARAEALCAARCRTRWAVAVAGLSADGRAALVDDDELLLVWAPVADRDASLASRRRLRSWPAAPPPGPLLLLVR